MIREILNLIKEMFTWFILVNPWEAGVRTRLGKHQLNIGPGIHLRIPFFDRVYIQSVRRRMSVVPAMTLTTTDGKTITVGSYLSFEIEDVAKLYNTLHDATDTIDAIAASVVSNYIHERRFAEVKPIEMQDHTNKHLDLGRFGLSNSEYFITSFAHAKAYRFITGAFKDYDNSDTIDTTKQYSMKQDQY